MQPTLRLRFDGDAIARNVLLVCAAMEILWFTLDFNINYAEGSSVGAIQRLFNTAREDSLSSWFGIMQTAAVAATVWLVYLVVREQGPRRRRLGWLAIALFFSYLALDDGAHIHERVGTFYELAVEGPATGGIGALTDALFPSYEWQIVFMPGFAAMGLFMFGFLLRELPARRDRVILFVALSLLASAVVLDFFEGLAPEHPFNPYTTIAATWHLDYWTARTFRSTPYDTLQHFSRSIEECIEMFAFTLLWFVFIGQVSHLWRDVSVTFEGASPAAALPGAAATTSADRDSTSQTKLPTRRVA